MRVGAASAYSPLPPPALPQAVWPGEPTLGKGGEQVRERGLGAGVDEENPKALQLIDRLASSGVGWSAYWGPICAPLVGGLLRSAPRVVR